MICPNCGRSTPEGDICQHCQQSTQFTLRSRSRPGPIPGIPDLGTPPPVQPDPPRNRLPGVLLLCTLICLLTSVVTVGCLVWAIGFVRQLPETLAPEPPSPSLAATVPETVQTALPEPVQIFFQENLPQSPSSAPLPPITQGQLLPGLPDTQHYRFLGWNTSPNGKGTALRPGDPFDLALVESVTLYAQWEAAPSTESLLPLAPADSAAEADLPTPPAAEVPTPPAAEVPTPPAAEVPTPPAAPGTPSAPAETQPQAAETAPEVSIAPAL